MVGAGAGWTIDDLVAALQPPRPRRPPPIAVAEELLPRSDVVRLVDAVVAHREEFVPSRVVDTGTGDGRVDHGHRRSTVLPDSDPASAVVAQVRAVLPWVHDRLGIRPFPVSRIDAQITTTGDGEFFGPHRDSGDPRSNGHDPAGVAARRVTFVYFFHREPRAFTGGELCIHEGPMPEPARPPRVVVPAQNTAVFFASDVCHEIRPVRCESRRFEDGRFAVNGWVLA